MAVAERQQERLSCIPAGTIRMGSQDFYPEEAPVREFPVEGFWMDEHADTAADFRAYAYSYRRILSTLYQVDGLR